VGHVAVDETTNAAVAPTTAGRCEAAGAAEAEVVRGYLGEDRLLMAEVVRATTTESTIVTAVGITTEIKETGAATGMLAAAGLGLEVRTEGAPRKLSFRL